MNRHSPHHSSGWLSSRLETAVHWLDERRALGYTRGALALILFAIPAAADFSLVSHSRWWIAAVICAVLFGVLEVYQARMDGVAADRVMARIAETQGKFAGGVDTIRSYLLASKGRKLGHPECRHLCGLFLGHIRSHAVTTFQPAPGVQIRATLLVPRQNSGTGDVESLKVWAYDDSHPGRRNTEVPLRSAHGFVVPGAPRAYLQGAIDFISDIHRVTGVPEVASRKYRSIVSFPLDAPDPATGRPLAVVCIDADRVAFFDGPTTLEKLFPLIAPAMNAIGLVLALRNQGKAYEFPL